MITVEKAAAIPRRHARTHRHRVLQRAWNPRSAWKADLLPNRVVKAGQCLAPGCTRRCHKSRCRSCAKVAKSATGGRASRRGRRQSWSWAMAVVSRDKRGRGGKAGMGAPLWGRCCLLRAKK